MQIGWILFSCAVVTTLGEREENIDECGSITSQEKCVSRHHGSPCAWMCDERGNARGSCIGVHSLGSPDCGALASQYPELITCDPGLFLSLYFVCVHL